MNAVSRPKLELADVIRLHGEQFIQQHNPLKQHLRTLNAILKCRTSALGGHVDRCDGCGHERISYNSCRNRHCPKCQGTNRERWIVDRQKDLLPVPYFHVVFTLPEQLNTLCLSHPKQLYNILFQASKQTVIQLGLDPKHLGAKPGMITVLHTWGQQLWLHPHVHCIIPGGGITKAGYWRFTKSNGKFLFPIKVMSAVFRGKFIQMLKKFCTDEKISLPVEFINSLYKNDWVVYAKQPFAGPKQVIEYLGRYTHRIAISNHRIKSIEDGKIGFSYKDYRQGGVQKIMTLDAGEFLRRFCLHILPPGFRKIRHYGMLANRAKSKLKLQQMKMGISIVPQPKMDWKQVARDAMGFDVDACPCCITGRMHTIRYFAANAPPKSEKISPTKS
jgi:predicted Zn-ribbon and HTH transcriptional regulator